MKKDEEKNKEEHKSEGKNINKKRGGALKEEEISSDYQKKFNSLKLPSVCNKTLPDAEQIYETSRL